ncbi:Oidioi.mRNA.OKI2018_I69.PAR.g10017.t1.cds [Oikopleura dioica]|uniref:ribonuclease H n=1 Tax=Oikopleura dioica TaxID=34765 RepID=A0ABN7RSS7_OIKDI|nr:Oidioi.mRNA.OKI2018_I69.PAR.g10017.t1.cds [Oikopleura dioica]
MEARGKAQSLVKISVQLDTGAEVTCIGERILEKLDHKVKWQRRFVKGVSGKRIGIMNERNENKVCDIELMVNGNPWMISDAIVLESIDGLLMGVTDMDGNTSIDMVNRRIVFEKFKVAASYDRQNVLKISTKHELSDGNFEPDARKTYKEKLEKMRKEARESSTVDDIVLGEVVKENPKLEERLMTKIRDKKYKKVFSKVTGCLPKEFEISAPMMRVELSNQVTRQKNEQMSDEKKEIVAKHLDELARDYIVVFPQDHGISVKNIIPIMVVEKRDDQGEAIPLAQSARIVAQAHRSVNLWTKAPPRVTDELKDVLAKAAKASKNKFMMKTDISQAFFQLPTEKALWPYFGVYHPYKGVMCYTRASQGWIASMGMVREAFLRIFEPLKKYMVRYADDVFISANNEDEFVLVVTRFLDICAHFNLSLKGSKMAIGVSEMNFLGAKVKGGKIVASPHQAQKIRDYDISTIKTVSDLRSFLGILVPLSKFKCRATDFLVPLRKCLDNDGKAKIVWTEEAKEAIKMAKKAMDELTELTPFDEDKQQYIVVDSSAKGTGAILFQKELVDGKEINRVVEFYSRKRPDSERKYTASSCMLETAGLVGALCYWRRYLIESKFPTIVFTDSMPLTMIAKRWTENLTPSDIVSINNLFKAILGLRIVVRHLPGKSIEISGVDFISRSSGHMEECDAKRCKICEISQTPRSDQSPFISEEKLEEINKEVRKLKDWHSSKRIMIVDDQFTEEMSNEIWSANCDEVVEVDYNKEAFQTVAMALRERKARDLLDFLKDEKTLRKMQLSDKLLKEVIKYVEKDLNPPPRKQRLNTLCKKAFLEKGYLKIKR